MRDRRGFTPLATAAIALGGVLLGAAALLGALLLLGALD